MRVEVTFGGDSLQATEASRMVVDALQKVFLQSDVTAGALREVKITSAQAAESRLEGRRIEDTLQGIQREARQTRRDLDSVQLGGLQGTAANLRSLRTVGIAGLLGLGGAVSGPVGLAAGGALAAVPGFIATLTAGVAGLELAFHGMGKAIEGDKKAFDALAPSAQQFVQTVRSLDPFLKRLQEDVRASVLPASTGFLHELFNPANVRAFESAATEIGQALSGGIKQLGDALGSRGFTVGFATFAKNAAEWLREDADAAIHFATGLGRISLAGLPLTDWLTKSIDGWSRLFDEWTRNAQASGQLADGMDKAKQELQLVAKLVEALAVDVFKLSRDLEPLGNKILLDVTHALQDFGHWLDQNREQINEVAQGALAGLEAALTAVKNILVPLGNALYDVTQKTIGFKNAAELLVAVWASWKIGTIVQGLVGAGGIATAARTATAEITTLRFALLSLGSPAVLAAMTAATLGGYKLGQSLAGDPNGGFGPKLAQPKVTNQGNQVNVSFPAGSGLPAITFDLGKFIDLQNGVSKQSPFSDIRGNTVSIASAAKELGVTVKELMGQLAKVGSVSQAQTLFGQVVGTNRWQTAAAGAAGGASLDKGRAKLIDLAKSMIGTPYLWGGSGPGGFDCSGLVMWAFGQEGVQIPHFTGSQYQLGSPVSAAHAQAGDIVFTEFDKKGVPQHEGLYIGGGQVIEAPHTGDQVKQISLAAFTAGRQYAIRDIYSSGGAGYVPPGSTSSAFGTPPPFTKNLGAAAKVWSLAPELQSLLTTSAPPWPGADLGSETKGLRTVIAAIRKQLGSLKGADLAAAQGEISILLTQLQGLTATGGATGGTFAGSQGPIVTAIRDAFNRMLPVIPKRADFSTPGRYGVTPASRLSASNYASNALQLLMGSDPLRTPTSASSVQEALKPFEELRSKLGPEIRAIQKELKSPWLAPETESVLRAQLTQYRHQITVGLQNARQAIVDEKSRFQDAWQQLGQTALESLQQQASNYKSPADIVLEQLQSAHDDAQLQQALEQANKDLANALVPVPDNQQIVTNIKAIIGTYTQANVIDQVQSAILGGTSTGVDSSSLLTKLHDALAAPGRVDPGAVERAQQEIEDAKYQIQVAGLQKQSKEEHTAYDAQVTAQEDAIQRLNKNWNTYFTALGGNITGIASKWAALLAGMGVSSDVVGAVVAAAQTGGLVPATSGSPGSIVSGYGPGGPIWLHAEGGIATRPIYRNVIGEAGPEAIIPLNDPRAQGMLGGGTIELHMHGDIGSAVRTEISSPHTLRIIDHGLGGETDRRRRARTY